jgi:hypothetical protein
MPPAPDVLRTLITATSFVPSEEDAMDHHFLSGTLFEIQVSPELVEV